MCEIISIRKGKENKWETERSGGDNRGGKRKKGYRRRKRGIGEKKGSKRKVREARVR